MKFSLAVLASTLLATVQAKNVVTLPGTHALQFRVTRGNTFEDSNEKKRPRFVKRTTPDGTVLMELDNESTFYSVPLLIGSDQQQVTVLVDTGSSDLWVPSSTNPYCSSNSGSSKRRIIDDSAFYESWTGQKLEKRDAFRVMEDSDALSAINNGDDDTADVVNDNGVLPSGTVNKAVTVPSVAASQATMDCSQYGTFNVAQSSSFSSNNTDFFILYGDSTYALGTWGVDTLNIGGINVDNLSFAVANQSNSSMGVLGIGLTGLETTNTGALAGSGAYTYSNLPVKMVEDGLINTPAYSLYLNKWSEDTGSVLFGGVDHAKYEGQLQVVPILNTLASRGYTNPIQLQISLDTITINSSSNSVNVSTESMPALLDSGTTLTYLPSDVVSSIASSLGAQYSSQYGYYLLRCPSSSSTIEITYTFQGITINVPLSEVVLAADTSGSVCALAMMASSQVILGDSFLRSAYVVYDLKNFEIGLAQAQYTDDEDIEVISDRIPSGTRVSDYSSTATGTGTVGPVQTGGAGTLGSSTRTSTVTNTRATASSSRGSDTAGAANAVGVPGWIGALALVWSVLF